MTDETTPRGLWRKELGDAADPLWDAFRMTEPPAPARMAKDRRGPSWTWFGLAASWLAIAVLFAWNVNLQNDVTESRKQAALVLLAAQQSDRVFAGLANARHLISDPAITAELLHLLKTSADPNVQLEALELLLDDVLQDPALRRDVLEEVHFNRSFIELALQAQEIRL